MANYREKLDSVFSKYIRVLYSDYIGYVTCYTCERILAWQEAQCGHFIRRQHSSVRFDKNNCRPQCYECNMIRDGMEESFEEHLRDDLGDEEVDALLEKGKEEKSYTDEEYKQLIHYYTMELKRMGVII